ncbi:NAD-dependent malic enzyme [Mycobacterium lacus]|uniref:NAD-dependent malic enzyme n=1 Tax=Mycobacterium lacus TaxID=169765 RepID=A0A1X1Y182_9MYCO|nr:NAD-dependent malic enzyme [Mycobacterium lacus]MCV7123323.1 NAD-dependent malic enzyme [Mycobacterium lacus]ORW04750.1 NAD-dependent malic enzyme [Mycobacterium lacus]BBX97103.1 NAD-dependent malic enzyme [Mycobacterium lacus]
MGDPCVPRIPLALSAPSLNRGVGFTHEERRRLGLTGRLPSAVLTLDEQADRVWHQLQSLATDLGRNLLLEQLHYRHELLYFKVLEDHLPELMPVVYTPTVGEAIQRFSDEYRGQRGLFLSIDEPDEIAGAFETFGLGPDDVDLIVCTDAEAILGIGDWGVGGIQIAVGKLALYTAGGGIDPRRCIAVSLDVGTDNEQLLADPFYLGNRHARRRGAEYDRFIGRYVETAHRLFPHAMLHFEDFGPANARVILQRYGADYCVFNDDVQGTGAVVVAAGYGGSRVTGIPMRDQTTIVFGAGTAGMGIADQIRDAMVADGATIEQATSQIWAIDKQGLLFDDMDDLRDFQVPYAKNRRQLGVAAGHRVGLVDAIKMASPTILLGCSTVYGAFTREVIEAMTASCERPMIFPLSNPTSRMEAMPADVLGWSNGKALLATGSPVAPVEYGETTYTIGQANNVLVFPGIGLSVIVARAKQLTPNMLHAAANAIARQANPTNPGDSLLPDVKDLRSISMAVAEAVYHAAVDDEVATRTHDNVRQAILDTMWVPRYD